MASRDHEADPKLQPTCPICRQRRGAFVVSTLSAGNLVGRMIAGWLIDRFSAARVAAALLAMAAAGFLRLAEAQTFARVCSPRY